MINMRCIFILFMILCMPAYAKSPASSPALSPVLSPSGAIKQEVAGSSLPAPNTDLSAYSVEIDFDFRSGKSIDGDTIYNMAASPASGAARTDYTFTNIGATANDGYLQFDGNDYLEQESATITSFIDGLQKTDNSQDFTLCVVVLTVDGSVESRMFFETRSGAATNPGIALYFSGASEEMFALQRGDTGAGVATATTTDIVPGTPRFVSYAFDKSVPTITFGNGGTYEAETWTYNATTTGISGKPRISGSDFSANNDLNNGERIYQWILFSQVLSQAELNAVQAIIETRTGLTF